MGLIVRIRQGFSRKYYPIRIRKTAALCGRNLYCGAKSFVTKNTFLGDNVNFNGMSILGSGKVTIGSYFHSGKNCQIITSFHDYDNDFYIPYGFNYINKDVTIEECVWLGNNVIILGGVTIGEGAIVQAGSVVCMDIPKYGIAGGHPAKVFKYRNIEHYLELKQSQKFH